MEMSHLRLLLLTTCHHREAEVAIIELIAQRNTVKAQHISRTEKNEKIDPKGFSHEGLKIKSFLTTRSRHEGLLDHE